MTLWRRHSSPPPSDDMHAHDAIEARRSVKKYDATHEMTDEEVDALVRLAMLSPTAFNIQHWRIVRFD